MVAHGARRLLVWERGSHRLSLYLRMVDGQLEAMHGPASRALAWQLGLYSKTMAFPHMGVVKAPLRNLMQVSFEKEATSRGVPASA